MATALLGRASAQKIPFKMENLPQEMISIIILTEPNPNFLEMEALMNILKL